MRRIAVTANPPLLAGAVNAIVADPFPGSAVTRRGGDGRDGTMLPVVADGLVPLLLSAVTAHVYDLPLDTPASVIGECAALPLRPTPPLDEVHDAW